MRARVEKVDVLGWNKSTGGDEVSLVALEAKTNAKRLKNTQNLKLPPNDWKTIGDQRAYLPFPFFLV